MGLYLQVTKWMFARCFMCGKRFTWRERTLSMDGEVWPYHEHCFWMMAKQKDEEITERLQGERDRDPKADH